MRVHMLWLGATIIVACVTGYVTYNFTREVIFGAQVALSVSEEEAHNRILESLDKSDINLAKTQIRKLKDINTRFISSLMPILENGHFQSTTQKDINAGRKYLNSPNQPLEPTR